LKIRKNNKLEKKLIKQVHRKNKRWHSKKRETIKGAVNPEMALSEGGKKRSVRGVSKKVGGHRGEGGRGARMVE